jgi:cytochrome c oxidase subunit 2
MSPFRLFLILIAVGLVVTLAAAPALAQEGGFDFTRAIAKAEQFESIPDTPPPISSWMSKPVTSISRQVKFNALWITLFASPFLILPNVLLIISIFRFREDGIRKPATFHENIELEMIWTIIPVFALVIMAIPSYHLMRYMENPPVADERVEVIGHQFFWEYRFPEYGIVYSDEPLVVPVNANIVLDMTSSGVNHAWWVPAFGVKMDTVPGRINTIWFNAEETGWYKGQCAELCGALHSRMLIDVFVVTKEEFDEWVNRKLIEMKEDVPAEAADPTEPAELPAA